MIATLNNRTARIASGCTPGEWARLVEAYEFILSEEGEAQAEQLGGTTHHDAQCLIGTALTGSFPHAQRALAWLDGRVSEPMLPKDGVAQCQR